jgi:CubicO group peptidase (beta-lactamase class C family)
MDQDRWQDRLTVLAQKYGVPGAQLAVLCDGQLVELATGVLNVETGVQVTAEAVFQIGSVTKAYTTVLAMQLADEGQLALDQPILELLPELRLADMDNAAKVTVRHLLSHTSGIEGEHFEDTGRGDDALERYVESCARIGFCHPVGATFSYCNTGLVLVGRLIEKLTGQTWDAALQQRLAAPLGLSHTLTLAEEAMRYRVAYGHDTDEAGTPRLVSSWQLPRSLGPAGLVCSTASDVVAFARMHLDGGRSVGGTQIVSAEAVAQMREPQVDLPDPWTLAKHWGLGWELFDWGGRGVFGHDGNTIGQAAFLRVVPDRGVALALLTNGGHGRDLYQALVPDLVRSLCDLKVPDPLVPPAVPPSVDVSPFAGTYGREGVRIELENRDGVLAGRVVATGTVAEIQEEPVQELTCQPVGGSVFVTRSPGQETWTPMVFFEVDGLLYLHMGGRAAPRVD